MAFPMNRDQAAAAAASASAERDGIQANLLDLDGSFGKRLLEGAALTGVSQQAWQRAAADLASLWGIFSAYEAAVDRAAGLLGDGRRLGGQELSEISMLLTGASVTVTRAPAPLARRDLTDSGRSSLTLDAAVSEMKRLFTSVTETTAAAESVWNETADGLSEIGASLDRAAGQATGLGDEVAGQLAAASAELARLRGVLNTDPLALWRGGRVDTGPLGQLRSQAATAVARVNELTRVRADASQRIAGVRASCEAAAAAWQDAMAARALAAAKVTTTLQPPPTPADLNARLATLATLRDEGRWTRLAGELDALGKDATAARDRYRDAERAASALLSQRDELRGLLDAYQAKAARLGAAEDAELTARYQQARELLWTAPCDLAAAQAAVTSYQQAILALDGRRQSR